jgi:hypothetical protein
LEPATPHRWLTARPIAEKYVVQTAFNVLSALRPRDQEPALCLKCLREVIGKALAELRGERLEWIH